MFILTLGDEVVIHHMEQLKFLYVTIVMGNGLTNIDEEEEPEGLEVLLNIGLVKFIPEKFMKFVHELYTELSQLQGLLHGEEHLSRCCKGMTITKLVSGLHQHNEV